MFKDKKERCLMLKKIGVQWRKLMQKGICFFFGLGVLGVKVFGLSSRI
jgi:hypothetical protein